MHSLQTVYKTKPGHVVVISPTVVYIYIYIYKYTTVYIIRVCTWLLTEKGPGHKGVSIQLLGHEYIAHGQLVQLRQLVPARGVHGHQHRPGDADAHDEDVAQDLEEAQEEEAVERPMAEHKGVGRLKKGLDPVEKALGKSRGWFSEV